jgi:diguanylate cyclase (GGDEF)-like protein
MDDEIGQSLIERADGALYASKQAGRNCAHVHTGESCEHFGAALPIASANGGPDESPSSDDAYTDRVTRLPTRKVLIEELKRRLSEIKRYDSTMSLMLVQLDELRQLNDPSEAMVENVRSVVGEFTRNMMRDTDLVTRFATNQFAVLMPSTALTAAMIPAERLRVSVGRCRSLNHNGSTLNLTISIGLTVSQAGDDPACILGRAQEALKLAAVEGGNRCCLHNGKGCDSVSSAPGWAGLLDLPQGGPASQLQDS